MIPDATFNGDEIKSANLSPFIRSNDINIDLDNQFGGSNKTINFISSKSKSDKLQSN